MGNCGCSGNQSSIDAVDNPQTQPVADQQNLDALNSDKTDGGGDKPIGNPPPSTEAVNSKSQQQQKEKENRSLPVEKFETYKMLLLGSGESGQNRVTELISLISTCFRTFPSVSECFMMILGFWEPFEF